MTDFPAAGYFSDALRINSEAKAAQDNMLAATKQLPGAQARSELTVATGSITPTRFVHSVDTESNASTDNLDNIATTNIPDGGLLLLYAEDASRVNTLRHAQGGAGELLLTNSENFALDATTSWIRLRRSGTQWIEESRRTLFGNRVAAVASASALRTLAGLIIGTDVQAYDADTLKGDVEDQVLTGGARVTPKDLGTVTSGTTTPDPGDRPMQKYINGGAHTLAPGSNYGSYLLDIVNNGSAGAITTSGWTKVVGSSFTTTNAHKFRCHCSITAEGSLLSVQAMQ